MGYRVRTCGLQPARGLGAERFTQRVSKAERKLTRGNKGRMAAWGADTDGDEGDCGSQGWGDRAFRDVSHKLKAKSGPRQKWHCQGIKVLGKTGVASTALFQGHFSHISTGAHPSQELSLVSGERCPGLNAVLQFL